jgi:hypothetical protein
MPHSRFDCRNLNHGLAGTGIECPVVDDRLLRAYFDYFVSNGYLPAPTRHTVGEG